MDSRAHQATKSNQTPNTILYSTGVRLWGINFMVERETAQTASKGPRIQTK